ncbi:hypothetical protein ACFOLJ_26450 [Rugamonas sp. CCM 8940]|uniref:hypothetical protein n=1 Tax=Rugamonas sp. CCM 8940 TaxID=2765359 RepID=UPI0018F31768|nr:hypothetical protein [Rugamonas sp. CCM 8940]MBJ7313395.1 hypothetical protein [Rugamonas sp. CCM 8940]
MSSNGMEKIDIIFSMRVAIEFQEKIINGVEFELLPGSGEISDFDALQTIVGVMQRLGLTMEFDDCGKIQSAYSYLKKVEKEGRWGRNIEACGLSFCFGNVTALKYSFITIKELTKGAAVSWEEWISPFIDKPGFVQAWVSDVAYDHWQNAKDLLEYTAVGRDYSQLPMTSNGLPPPLEQKIVDISNNPGRWMLQSGYVEAIGAVMWLGEEFWNRVGIDRKDHIRKENWLRIEALTSGILRLQTAECCFSDESTARVQNDLRALLYG